MKFHFLIWKLQGINFIFLFGNCIASSYFFYQGSLFHHSNQKKIVEVIFVFSCPLLSCLTLAKKKRIAKVPFSKGWMETQVTDGQASCFVSAICKVQVFVSGKGRNVPSCFDQILEASG